MGDCKGLHSIGPFIARVGLRGYITVSCRNTTILIRSPSETNPKHKVGKNSRYMVRPLLRCSQAVQEGARGGRPGKAHRETTGGALRNGIVCTRRLGCSGVGPTWTLSSDVYNRPETLLWV